MSTPSASSSIFFSAFARRLRTWKGRLVLAVATVFAIITSNLLLEAVKFGLWMGVEKAAIDADLFLVVAGLFLAGFAGLVVYFALLNRALQLREGWKRLSFVTAGYGRVRLGDRDRLRRDCGRNRAVGVQPRTGSPARVRRLSPRPPLHRVGAGGI